MNIKVRDNRSFGRRPIVGVHCIKSLQPYRCSSLEHIDAGDETGMFMYKGECHDQLFFTYFSKASGIL